MSIYFKTQAPYQLENKRILKNFIKRIFLDEARELDTLTFIICTDRYLLKLNKKYLNHNYYTDILTFDLSENASIIGEIYISIDRVIENSKIYKTLIINELYRIMIHGILHLSGYNDISASQKNKMTKKENHYLKLLEECFT